jgi:hypothetical protein
VYPSGGDFAAASAPVAPAAPDRLSTMNAVFSAFSIAVDMERATRSLAPPAG